MSVVLGKVLDRKDEASEQHKLAELAEMELVATGHHWDVPKRFRLRVVSSYWKSTVDPWKQVTGSGLTSTYNDYNEGFEAVCRVSVHSYA